MALTTALLLSLLLTTALGGMTIVAAIERRAASSHRLSVELRAAAHGAVSLAAGDLAQVEWDPLLAGAGSPYWRTPAPGFDVAAATARLRTEAMMGGAHGADTPVWQVLAQTPWEAVAGRAGPVRIVTWVADDWTERDGQATVDSNGRLIVRALAFAGEAQAWAEAVCGRAGARVRVEHIRVW